MFDSDALPTPSGPINWVSGRQNGPGAASAPFPGSNRRVNEVDIFFFQAGDQRGEIFPPAVIPSKKTTLALAAFSPSAPNVPALRHTVVCRE